MTKSLDSQFAEYTDDVINGNVFEEKSTMNKTDDLTPLRMIVDNLNRVGNNVDYSNSQDKILLSLKNDWDRLNPQTSGTWRSVRQRRSIMTFAVAFATIIIIAVLFPQFDTSGGGLPASANGDYWVPLLLVLSSVAIVAFFVNKKNKSK